MTDLPMVSLIAYDNTDHPERTLSVVHYCRRFFNFAESILVCRTRPKNRIGNETLFLTQDTGYHAAMSFELNIGKFVHGDYSLFVSHDGYILNPDNWNSDWLNYDIIGAPWPDELVRDRRYRVGNTGFCLRSRKFMDLCVLLGRGHHDGVPADVFSCQMMRPLLEEACGVKYAPIDVAAAFSWEFNIKEYPNGRPDAFGFHALNSKAVPQIR